MAFNRNYTKIAKNLALSLLVASPFYVTNLKAASCDVSLSQSDFLDGTYIIKTPGIYCLTENISFNPNNAAYLRTKFPTSSNTAYDASFPLPSQLGMGPGQYDPQAFGLGFFAAIAVASPDVTINLKGFTLEQSEEHALLQRFFSIIETSDRPFISGQGPHDFGDIVGAAENLVIKNGVLGRSSHHGIHGNRAKNVFIKNIYFKGFEVAAVAMNGVIGLKLKNLNAVSRTDVPILGQFSTAQFIKPYLNYLVNSESTTTLNGQSASDIQNSLKSAINNVHKDLIIDNKNYISQFQHPSEWNMFHNPTGVVDGNSYGFLINGVGVAVNGFPSSESTDSPSKDIVIDNVNVKYLKAHIREVVALVSDGIGSSHVKDPIGSIFQVLATNPNGQPLAISTLLPASSGTYIGNVVTDAQAIVAKAALNGEFPGFLNTIRNSINDNVIAWVESGLPLSTYLTDAPGPHGTGFLCNGDQMFHVNKGVIGFKLDGSNKVTLQNSKNIFIANTGNVGSTLCGDYSVSHPGATLEGFGGAIVRGISISGLTDVKIEHFINLSLRSQNGSAIGVDVLTDSSDVVLKNTRIGITGIGSSEVLPTASPEAIGYRVGLNTSNVKLNRYCARKLTYPFSSIEILQDLSGNAQSKKECK